MRNRGLAVVIDVRVGVGDDGWWGGKKHEVIESYSKHVTHTHTLAIFLSLSVSLLCEKTLAEYPPQKRHNRTTAEKGKGKSAKEEKLQGNSGNINQVNQPSVMDGVGVSYQRQKGTSWTLGENK